MIVDVHVDSPERANQVMEYVTPMILESRYRITLSQDCLRPIFYVHFPDDVSTVYIVDFVVNFKNQIKEIK